MPTPPPHAAPVAPVGARRLIAMRRLVGVLLAVVAGFGLGLSLPAAAHAGAAGALGPATTLGAAAAAPSSPGSPGTSAVDLPSPGLPFAHGQGRTTLDALGARVTQVHPVDAADAAARPAAAALVRALHHRHTPASAPRDGGHAPSPARAPPAA